MCGGQTHSIIRNGIDRLLPPEVHLIHGPGCPVCVTPLVAIDKALAIAALPGVVFCSFGDMLRVPGSSQDLFRIKSEGGDVRIVYSPLDTLKIARDYPTREVVLFAIGFETTAPANAMAVDLAKQQGITNFSVPVSHLLVPAAIAATMSSPMVRVQAFLAAGHVCSVMGYWEYPMLAERFKAPIVIAGFEPLDVLQGILLAVRQLERGQAKVERMAKSAAQAAVRIVSGDTKVVERGKADGCFVTTAGIGILPDGPLPGPQRAKPGDAVPVSGTIGDHGITVMSVREGLDFETSLESDSAALYSLVEAMMRTCRDIHVMRDPTRGGVASSLNEIAAASGVGIRIDETALPVKPQVTAACEILGLDPIYVANEGKLLAIVAEEDAEALLECMQAHPLGHGAAIIGHITEEHPGMLTARTAFGATRIIPMQIGEQLPRIC